VDFFDLGLIADENDGRMVVIGFTLMGEVSGSSEFLTGEVVIGD
jgi:hypothetical protein